MLFFRQNSILIDEENVNNNLNWYCSDQEENAISYDEQIFYNFNSQGYRTKEIKNLDKNFILVSGCSYTEGVGLAKDQIWCELLSNFLDIDLLNLAKTASSPDILYLNTLQYITLNYPKPKLVILQWPNCNRKSFGYKDNNKIKLCDRNVNNIFFDHRYEKLDTQWYLKRYLMETGEQELTNYIQYTATNNLWKNYNVPVFNWTWSGEFEPGFLIDNLYVQHNENNDRARDSQHDGPMIHKEVAEKIYKKIKKASLL